MDFRLNERQLELQKKLKELIGSEIAPKAASTDRAGIFPSDNWKKLAEAGFMAITLPEEGATDWISGVMAVEELASGCPSTALCVGASAWICGGAIAAFGSDAAKSKWCPKLASGEAVGAYAITDPEGGYLSDISIEAVEADGGYELSGSRTFVTNANQADVIVVMAKTEEGEPAVFIVEKEAGGYEVGEPVKTLGMRGAPCAEIKFNKCPVADDNRLQGNGAEIASRILVFARLHKAALSTGIGRAAFEEGKAYAETRRSGGKPIGAYQEVAFKISDMYIENDTGRMLTNHAAYLLMEGDPEAETEVSVAKLYASETAARNANRALQVFGGKGYTLDTAAERIFRDARFTEIADGTSEVQRMKIANAALGEDI